jgi:hypothetical protein
MRTRTERLVIAFAWGFIVFTGGTALGFTATGLLYLWPGFDPLNMQPAVYWARPFIAFGLLVGGMPFAGFAAIVWYGLRRRLRT